MYSINRKFKANLWLIFCKILHIYHDRIRCLRYFLVQISIKIGIWLKNFIVIFLKFKNCIIRLIFRIQPNIFMFSLFNFFFFLWAYHLSANPFRFDHYICLISNFRLVSSLSDNKKFFFRVSHWAKRGVIGSCSIMGSRQH